MKNVENLVDLLNENINDFWHEIGRCASIETILEVKGDFIQVEFRGNSGLCHQFGINARYHNTWGLMARLYSEAYSFCPKSIVDECIKLRSSSHSQKDDPNSQYEALLSEAFEIQHNLVFLANVIGIYYYQDALDEFDNDESGDFT